MSKFPTPEEIESQQSPFDPAGKFPYDYQLILIEQVEADRFEEQLRTYTIEKVLSEERLEVPNCRSVEKGRQFRRAQPGDRVDMRIMGPASEVPIELTETL